MAIHDMPACCTVRVVTGFGNSHTADPCNSDLEGLSFEGLLGYLLSNVSYYRKLGNAALIATTNNEQTVANRALRAAGFKSTRYISKKKHPEARIKVWIKYLDEAVEGI